MKTIVVTAAVIAGVLLAPPAHATEDETVLGEATTVVEEIDDMPEDVGPWARPDGTEEVAGEDRYDTAALVAQRTYPDGADTAVVVRGDDYADALSASGLASVLDAPVLLTPGEQLHHRTADALDDLGVASVTVIGGPAAVSDDVVTELSAERSTRRIGGADRYETAALVADELAGHRTAEVRGRAIAVVAAGDAWPDAVIGGAIAAGEQAPILLTRREEVPAATEDALETLDIERVLILGGDSVVALPTVRQLTGDYLVTRLAGADRLETAAAAAEWVVDDLGWREGAVTLAGDTFADPLVTANLAGTAEMPIIPSADPDRAAGVVADLGACDSVLAVGATTQAVADACQ